MIEYRLDVRPFLDEIGGGEHVVDSVEIPELVVGDETFVPRAPATFDVMVSNAGEALVAIGRVTAPVKATCSRCLCDFDTEISGDVEGYWPRPRHEVPPEQEVTGHVDVAGTIDLGPALMAALVVEAPFAPLHSEDCAGLCAVCGADLNLGPCECKEAVDPASPFAKLDGLLGDGDDQD
jgi:uncharacterized protein